MKKYKKKLLLISVILSLIIIILLLTFYNSGDNFKPDSDHSSVSYTHLTLPTTPYV